MSTYKFLTPREPIQSRDNIYYQYFTTLWGIKQMRLENDTSQSSVIMYLNPVVHICFSPMLAHRLRRWPSIGPTYSNCVRTTTCKILLTHALTSPKFQKWTPTTNRVICWTGEKEVMGSFPGIYLAMFYQIIRCLATVTSYAEVCVHKPWRPMDFFLNHHECPS